MSADAAKMGQAVHARLTEFLEGYVLIGFVPKPEGGSCALVIVSPDMDIKTRLALNSLLQTASQTLSNGETQNDQS